MEEYSNREIDMKFEAIQQHMKDSHASINEKLDAILTQTTRTNGRVSSLEKWRSYITGAVAVLTVLVLPALFIILRSHL